MSKAAIVVRKTVIVVRDADCLTRKTGCAPRRVVCVPLYTLNHARSVPSLPLSGAFQSGLQRNALQDAAASFIIPISADELPASPSAESADRS